MSAYVNRLLDRFSPSQADMAATAEPFVRSHSPVADFDQRPGSEDLLGLEPQAPDTVSPSLKASIEGGSGPQIHRKAMSQPVAAPTSAPAVAPSPASPTSNVAARPAAPSTPTKAPRREPLDPGPLFDVFPRYYGAPESVSAPSNHTATVEARSEPTSTPAKPSPAAVEVDAKPRRMSPAPRREPEQPSPTIEAPLRPAPWVAFEREIPGTLPIAAPLVTPATPRRPAAQSPNISPTPELEPSPAPLHYATPRPVTTAPYVPEPGRPSAEPSASARPRVHIGRVEVEVIPSNSPTPAQSGAAAPKQTLSIDSISQIGPLGQYFPSRRLLRLRYR